MFGYSCDYCEALDKRTKTLPVGWLRVIIQVSSDEETGKVTFEYCSFECLHGAEPWENGAWPVPAKEREVTRG